MSVIFRGLPACECLAEWLPVYERELQRRGILTGPLRIFQLIGGNPSSGGTHLGGGAADLLDLPGDMDVWVARQMGADATWHRPFNWDGNGGIEHQHGVLRGCPHLSESARAQIVAVDNNGDGLGGTSTPDPGPRPLSGRTWQQGIEWQRQQEDWFEMATEEELRAVVRSELEAFLEDATVNNPSDPEGKPWKLTRLLIDIWKRAGK